MTKYIDADRLKAEIERRIKSIKSWFFIEAEFGEEKRSEGKIQGYNETFTLINSLQQEQLDMGEVSDGYHTFNELYYYRMLYNAAFFNLLPKEWVHKSKRHHTGEECFGGGWFIVMANLPTGQISNHYELKDWDLFQVPEKEFADEWDGHTPQEAAERLHKYLQQEQLNIDKIKREWYNKGYLEGRKNAHIPARELGLPKSWDFQQEQSECSSNLVDVDAVREDFITEVYRVLDADPTNDRANTIINAFDSLPTVSQQPEVDLEKEIEEHVKGMPMSEFTHESEVGDHWDWAREEFRHFFELGFNARKEENK